MLQIRTEHGNFGSYKDLYLFMKEEELKEVVATTYYALSKVNCLKLTLSDVKKLADK